MSKAEQREEHLPIVQCTLIVNWGRDNRFTSPDEHEWKRSLIGGSRNKCIRIHQSLLAALTALTAWLTIPRKPTTERHRNVSMDWLGSFFIVSGLLLLSYALAAEPYADEHSEKDGFSTATVLGPLISGILCLIAALVVEWKFAKSPLVPLSFFNSWSVSSLSLACMCFYACFGNANTTQTQDEPHTSRNSSIDESRPVSLNHRPPIVLIVRRPLRRCIDHPIPPTDLRHDNLTDRQAKGKRQSEENRTHRAAQTLQF